MRFDELEKKVNELIKERKIDEKFQRFDYSFSEVEHLIEEVLGKRIEEYGRLGFDHYGTKGKLFIKNYDTYCNGIEITIRRKKGEEKKGGIWYYYTEYAVKSIEIKSEYETIEDFVEKQKVKYNNQLNEDRADYDNLIADLKKYGLDEKKFLDLYHQYNSLRYGYRMKFDGEKNWEFWVK